MRLRGAPRQGRVGVGPIPALALALVWTLGFEVAPLGHAFEHARSSSRAGAGAHCHDGTCHDDGASGAGVAATDHGEHTLAHRDVAARVPAYAIVRWPALVVGLSPGASPLEAPLTARVPTEPVARGPPPA